MYEIEVTVAPGVVFHITEETMGDLSDDVQQLGGNPGSLADRIATVFSAMPHGDGATEVARGLGGRVKPVEHQTERPTNRSTETAGADQTDSSTGTRDPWASDLDSEPSEEATPTRTTPSSSQAATRPNGASSRASSTASRYTDRWGNKYTFDLPEAPSCECGDKAARKQGKSRAGKAYTVWVCAKAGSATDWADKCEFSEFPPR